MCFVYACVYVCEYTKKSITTTCARVSATYQCNNGPLSSPLRDTTSIAASLVLRLLLRLYVYVCTCVCVCVCVRVCVCANLPTVHYACRHWAIIQYK